jgi:hypothetical protein
MQTNSESQIVEQRAPPTAGTKRRGLSEESRAGLVFVAPFLIGFVIFTVGPLIYSLYLSFTSYDVLSPPVWVGLRNYQRMLADTRFFKTLLNTLTYVALYVPTAIPLALGLALLLNARVRGLSFWRTAFYLPEITPAVAAGVLWLRILAGCGGGRAVAAHSEPAERPAQPGAGADRHPRAGLDNRCPVGQAGLGDHATVERRLDGGGVSGGAPAGA